MKALGVIINVLAVIVAGGVGSIFRGKLKTRYQEIIVRGVGLLAMILAIFGVIQSWFIFKDKQIELSDSILVILALLIGSVLGEALDMEDILNRLGRLFKKFAEEELTDGKKKRPVEEQPHFSGLAPKFKRGKAVFERDTLKIVEMDVLCNELFRLGARGEAGAVQAFRLQGAEEIFHRRVVVRASRAGHRRRNVVCLCQVEVCFGGVLRPLVTVEGESISDLFLF